jgi:F-type H+-transporting ATPase subunit a
MIFLFVFISNLVGMVPFSLTVTSYFLVSFYFALATFIALNIIGFVYNGSGI